MSNQTIGAKDFAEFLGPWTPQGVEASPAVAEVLKEDIDLSNAAEDATVLLLNELVQDKRETGIIAGRCYQATLSKPLDDGGFRYWLLLVITNADPEVPKSRMLILTPQEVKGNAVVWDLIGEAAQKTVQSMIELGT